jgi:hypothetical protein
MVKATHLVGFRSVVRAGVVGRELVCEETQPLPEMRKARAAPPPAVAKPAKEVSSGPIPGLLEA